MQRLKRILSWEWQTDPRYLFPGQPEERIKFLERRVRLLEYGLLLAIAAMVFVMVIVGKGGLQ